MADKNEILLNAVTCKINGNDVGYTKGGAKFSYTPTWTDVEADQAIGKVLKRLSNEVMSVSFGMLESQLSAVDVTSNFGVAFNTDTSNGQYLYFGNNDACNLEPVTVELSGNIYGTSCKLVVVHFYECYMTGTPEVTFDKSTETVINIEFEPVKRDVDGKFGWIYVAA